MKIEHYLGDKSYSVIVPKVSEQTICNTSFRGKGARFAGNFHLWGSVDHMFRDQFIVNSLIADAVDNARKGSFENSLCLDYGCPVGWTSNVRMNGYRREDLERCKLGKKGSAMFVRRAARSVLAPMTSLITLVYEYVTEKQNAVIVHTVHPGDDMGELIGDITEREGCVLFHFGHKGVPPARL